MSLISAISKLESNVNESGNESKEIRKIRDELKLMDEDYFLQLVRKIEFYCKQFDLECTAQNEYLMEMSKLDFDIAELIYFKYKQILDNPENIGVIKRELKSKMEQLEKQKKALVDIGAQLKLQLLNIY